MPLLPARPDIWVYSPFNGIRIRIELKHYAYIYLPGFISLKSVPSCLLYSENTMHLAGEFTPIANVSVAKRHLTKPREKSISTIFNVMLIKNKFFKNKNNYKPP